MDTSRITCMLFGVTISEMYKFFSGPQDSDPDRITQCHIRLVWKPLEAALADHLTPRRKKGSVMDRGLVAESCRC